MSLFLFLTRPLLSQADDFTDLKCVYSIYISWILNPTFFKANKKTASLSLRFCVIYFEILSVFIFLLLVYRRQ